MISSRSDCADAVAGVAGQQERCTAHDITNITRSPAISFHSHRRTDDDHDDATATNSMPKQKRHARLGFNQLRLVIAGSFVVFR